MGAGASVGALEAAREAARCATQEELEAAFADAPEEVRRKLATALGTPSAGSGVGVAPAPGAEAERSQTFFLGGGAVIAEITYEDELAFELNEQERLFQKCMHNRMQREAKRKLEKQQKREADDKKKKQAMEDSFDDEVDKLLKFFTDGFGIETADAYGTSLLSEASAGGASDCIQVLLGNGANPNRLGRFMRTPLWRAANAGHSQAVQLLLRAGGDPRTPDEVGAKPYHVANGADVKTLLEAWDISVTETIKQAVGANRQKVQKEAQERENKQKEEMHGSLLEAERRMQISRAEVGKKQKLVVTYRQQKVSMAETGQVAEMREIEGHLERAEAELDTAKRVLTEMEWQHKRARLKVRDFENKLRRKHRKESGEPISPVDQVIWLKDLSDVVLKDVGGKRREDGRWPLIFDPSGKSTTFFTYSGAVQFDAEQLTLYALSESRDEQRLLLKALLKHMKYGGAVMINLGEDISKMQMVEDAFNEIQKGLFNTLTDRSVLYSYMLPRRFLDVVPVEMRDEFSEYMFQDEELGKFTLGFIVKGNEPEPEVFEKECHMFYTVKVKDPDAPEPEEEEEDEVGA